MTTRPAATSVRIRPAGRGDVPDILAISNWAALNTAANFAVEPETLETWQAEWDRSHGMFPWLVAVDPSGEVRENEGRGGRAYEWKVIRPRARTEAGDGRVMIDGKEWAAELDGGGALAAGADVEVIGLSGGSRLRVKARN